jgi:uncharacterized membrane protein
LAVLVLVENDPTTTYATLIDDVGRGFEAAGVIALIVGCVLALGQFVIARRHDELEYRVLRRGLGRAILLGLELFVAGDIIRTVTVTPTFTTVGVLAIIVAIRTFLSFTLEVEINGRWPWQAATHATTPPGGSANGEQL